jgi:hypothetical protein
MGIFNGRKRCTLGVGMLGFLELGVVASKNVILLDHEGKVVFQ